jgi:hypothetical protein
MEKYIFISASKLHQFWKKVPKDILDNSLFFFGSKRHWLFPGTEDEIIDSKNQPTDYLSFDKDFLQLIIKKEKRNQVFFLKTKDVEHAGDYNNVSKWFTDNGYGHLWLTDEIWEKNIEYVNDKKYFDVSIEQIKYNYKTGNHFYNEVMALLKYSNESLIPIIEI